MESTFRVTTPTWSVRATLERLAAAPRVSMTVIHTVGSRGHDGFALAVVGAAPGEPVRGAAPG